MSFLEDGGATETKEEKNLLDDSSSSDDPEDFLSDSFWILNQSGSNFTAWTHFYKFTILPAQIV